MQYQTLLETPQLIVLKTRQEPQQSLCLRSFTYFAQPARGKDRDQCNICQDYLADWTTVSRLNKCRHIFCEDCIVGWIAQNRRTCPNCREAF